MKEYCLTHSYEAKPANTRNSLGYIVVDDENKIIYCTIPKVSTTTWKTVHLNLRGRKRNKVCKLPTVKRLKTDVSSVTPSSEGQIPQKCQLL